MQEISQQDDPKKFTQLPNSWEEKGIRKGREQGIEQGKEQGIEQGIEQGKEQELKKVVLEMLKEELPIDLIAKVTRLDEEAIEEIRKHN